MVTQDKSYVKSEVKGSVLVLKLKGRLDAICAAEIDRIVTKAVDEGSKYLVLNFSDVPYLSSAGLRLLLLTTIKLKSCKGKMVVCSLTDEVRYVINITGFNTVFEIYPTEQEALECIVRKKRE